ncbi:hypothetical protein DE167_004981 [Clostridium beijerinckii]|uniref:Uncharacterized protein n=1 Tax=Clostridium beijerinckii TaxID=1520 RepID=A0AAX0B0X7_CLOBE|nr:hypothetical protein [Clostridium beijerinckii]NYC74415.1 hypothetical protein [Clostridium beijerinckii]
MNRIIAKCFLDKVRIKNKNIRKSHIRIKYYELNLIQALLKLLYNFKKYKII